MKKIFEFRLSTGLYVLEVRDSKNHMFAKACLWYDESVTLSVCDYVCMCFCGHSKSRTRNLIQLYNQVIPDISWC